MPLPLPHHPNSTAALPYLSHGTMRSHTLQKQSATITSNPAPPSPPNEQLPGKLRHPRLHSTNTPHRPSASTTLVLASRALPSTDPRRRIPVIHRHPCTYRARSVPLHATSWNARVLGLYFPRQGRVVLEGDGGGGCERVGGW
ncbi:hypothetical protein P171DRAFT_226622 [Karstenula rhodostoma CBS 690.94]|uniref:Uncharacterized protein n=1 Tax=Karstenula rhodostoma CBS 690.94 TaxID=1392251 RepID=A0A9P4PP20_9PLEO|nr:hypothetical protein P171DRAFT_226622 [Karstenula rhodostoma CBS 690.94]